MEDILQCDIFRSWLSFLIIQFPWPFLCPLYYVTHFLWDAFQILNNKLTLWVYSLIIWHHSRPLSLPWESIINFKRTSLRGFTDWSIIRMFCKWQQRYCYAHKTSSPILVRNIQLHQRWLYIRTLKLARIRRNPEVSVVATQATRIVHHSWSNSLIWTITFLNSIRYPVQQNIYACCFERWPYALITRYSITIIGMFAYGLHILNHSLLGRRDRRLSTGVVGTPPERLVVRRGSEFKQGNYFHSQTVFALSWCKGAPFRDVDSKVETAPNSK